MGEIQKTQREKMRRMPHAFPAGVAIEEMAAHGVVEAVFIPDLPPDDFTKIIDRKNIDQNRIMFNLRKPIFHGGKILGDGRNRFPKIYDTDIAAGILKKLLKNSIV